MEQKKNRRFFTPIGVLLIIIFLAACSSPSVPPQELQPTETVQTTANTPVVTESAPTLCTNAYYPVREGAIWNYKSTGGPAGEYVFTDTITSVREDGFTLSTQIADLTRSQEWTCKPEGLVALQLGGAPTAMLNSQNIQLNLDVKNSSGVTFPSQMNVGDQWQQNVDVQGNVSVANEEAEATGNAQMNFAATGKEGVTVPAGTFDALKISVEISLDINAAYEGITLPVTFSGEYTYWFVPDVGWVKATGTGNVLGSSFSETTELQSYNVP